MFYVTKTSIRSVLETIEIIQLCKYRLIDYIIISYFNTSNEIIERKLWTLIGLVADLACKGQVFYLILSVYWYQ